MEEGVQDVLLMGCASFLLGGSLRANGVWDFGILFFFSFFLC